MILGIDASNIKNSGGLKHLFEFLNHIEPQKFGIERILLFGGNQLDELPNAVWLEKRKENLLVQNSFLKESFWKIIKAEKIFLSMCDIIFAPGGTFYSKKIFYISMSQNMLVFEKKEANRYGLSWIRLRLYILNFLQSRSLNNALGVIFISQYARDYITSFSKININKSKNIYFGSSDNFKFLIKEQKKISTYTEKNRYKILYVSIIDLYKHQDKLVNAISQLYKKGYPVELTLVGPIYKPYFKKFETALSKIDNNAEFIKYLGQVNYNKVSKIYKEADMFVFASTCENMPNILIEAMSAGLPIACSNYGPMPEFLQDAGEYFDPLNVDSIVKAIEKLMLNPELRYENAQKAYNFTQQLSWQKCANETLEFIVSCYQNDKP